MSWIAVIQWMDAKGDENQVSVQRPSELNAMIDVLRKSIGIEEFSVKACITDIDKSMVTLDIALS